MKIFSLLLYSVLTCCVLNIRGQSFTPNSVDSLGNKQGKWTEFRIPFEIATGEVLIKFPGLKKDYYSLKKEEDRKYFPIMEWVGEYEKGRKNGEWVEYYWNDTISSRINFKEGVPFGRCSKYWISGALKMEFEIGITDSVPVSTYDSKGEFLVRQMVSKIQLIQTIYKGL